MRKLYSYFIITLLVITIPLQAHASQLFNDKIPVFTNQNLLNQAIELEYSEITIMYSSITRTPLWSAEHLTKEKLFNAKNLHREDNFHPDSNINENAQAQLEDYKGSGYDRGHMSPAADMSTMQAQYESFTLTNIIPQDGDNNRNLWEGIESATRYLTYQQGELYIITGPVFSGDQIQQLNGKVMVPTYIFKAIYDPKTNQAGAYLVGNKPGMDYQIISIAELEKITGINLFPDLSDEIKTTAMNLPAPRLHSSNHAGKKHHNKYSLSFFN